MEFSKFQYFKKCLKKYDIIKKRAVYFYEMGQKCPVDYSSVKQDIFFIYL